MLMPSVRRGVSSQLFVHTLIDGAYNRTNNTANLLNVLSRDLDQFVSAC